MHFCTFEIVFLIYRHAGCWSLGWTPGRVMHSAGFDRPGGQESANESGRAAPPNHEPGSQELLSRPPSSFLPMWPRTAPVAKPQFRSRSASISTLRVGPPQHRAVFS